MNVEGLVIGSANPNGIGRTKDKAPQINCYSTENSEEPKKIMLAFPALCGNIRSMRR